MSTEHEQNLNKLKKMYQNVFQHLENIDMNVVYQCFIQSTKQYYQIIIDDNKLQFRDGQHQSPTLTLTFKSLDIPEKLMLNQIDSIECIMNKQVFSDSHLILSMQYFIMFANIPANSDLT